MLKRIIRVCIVIFVFCLSFHVEKSVFAQETYQEAIDKAQEEMERLEQLRKDTEARIEDLEKEKTSVSEYIQKVDAELTLAYEEMEVLEVEISACEEELKNIKATLDEVTSLKEEQYVIMKNRIKYMYENGETSFWEIILGSKSLEDLLNQIEYRSQIAKYDDSLLKRYEATCQEVKRQEKEYELQVAELALKMENQQIYIDSLNLLCENKANYMAEISDALGITEELYFNYFEEIENKTIEIEELKEKERLRIEEEERKRKEEEERQKAEEERKKKEEEERRKQAEEQAKLGLTDEKDPKKMIWPFPTDHRIFSYFGNRLHPITKTWQLHTGIDIGGKAGSDIVAALAGTVVIATWTERSGNYIAIDHGNGYRTYYMHASKLLVKVGDYVKQGQVIMKCGSTGWSTGPHLHFSVKVNGEYRDPLDYVVP